MTRNLEARQTHSDREKRSDPNIAPLLRLSAEEAETLFRSLSAPSADEIAGDHSGHIPDHISEDWHAFVADSRAGDWLGKGFVIAPRGRYIGDGYNRYFRNGSQSRGMRFAWRFEESAVDGLESLMMVYSAYNNWGGENDLIDEVRRYAPGVFLGIYHTKHPIARFAPRSGKNGRSAMEFFVLTGPIIQDIHGTKPRAEPCGD